MEIIIKTKKKVKSFTFEKGYISIAKGRPSAELRLINHDDMNMVIVRTKRKERKFSFGNISFFKRRQTGAELRNDLSEIEKRKAWEEKYPQLSNFDSFVKFYGSFITPENFYTAYADWDITGLRKIEGEGSNIYRFYTLLAPNANIKKYDSVGCECMSQYFKWNRLKKFVAQQRSITYPLKEGFLWIKKGRERKIFHIAANGLFREFHGRVPCYTPQNSRI